MLKPLHRQTIVITGATSGIGLATARRAAEEGARVILVSRSEDTLQAVRDEIREHGGRADYVVADVGVRDEVKHVVDEVVDRHGGFDTWVNDAGVGIYSLLDDLPDQDHERLFQTNYWGVVYGSTEAVRHLRRHGGALINIGSISSDMPAPILSAYTASKHAVKGFTDSLRLELIAEGAPVSVTLIKPSGIHSPFGRHSKNLMDHASVVPPPVYAPELVADAILHAAVTPTRSLIVGGAGRLMTWFAHLMPNTSDQVYARAFFKTALDRSRPKRDSRGLHRPGSQGRLYGDQGGLMRRTSLYTASETNPLPVLAAGLLAGLAGAALAAVALAPPAQRHELERQSRRRRPGRRPLDDRRVDGLAVDADRSGEYAPNGPMNPLQTSRAGGAERAQPY